jgi:succinate dehydrogenase / fumarate reductase cytochrome b subunit
MADVNRGKRPLSPFMLGTYYRLQLNSVTSLLTRITGNALLVGAVLVVWWLLAASVGDDYFARANAVMTSWFGKLVMLGSLWALWFHLLTGLRHLIWDQGLWLSVEVADRLSWACIVGSVVLTVLTIIAI